MDPRLNGLHIAILVTDGFEQAEFTEPKKALEQEGAITKVVSDKHGQVQSVRRDANAEQFDVDLTFDETDPDDFDAIVLPGGAVNAVRMRNIPEALHIVQAAKTDGKPIAAIGDGTQLLVAAGLVSGATLTSWPALRDDMLNAGANWIDQDVVVDGTLVSGRQADDLPAFNQKMIEVIAGRLQENLRGTPDEHAVGLASS